MSIASDEHAPVTKPKGRTRHELDAIETPLLRDAANWLVVFSGTANVVMQLANRPVAYGVMQSTVDEGNLFKNPHRRARTTLAYIAVCVLGTPAERAAMRKAVNGSHAHVRSDAAAEVAYNAFDPALQKWVAACLYRGSVESYTLVHGQLVDAAAEEYYQQAKVFGTTLQLRAEDWPADLAAFDEYWTSTLAGLEIDERTRAYLMKVVRMEYGPQRLPAWFERLRTRQVAGHLGPDFRRLMRLDWSSDDQRRYDAFNRRMRTLTLLSPRWLREAPLRVPLRDLRRRMAQGRPLL
ncbi:oxygenase MpaB family protein [Microbacterium sp. BWT-B31]|uniref:oxygenase MpaB family protein n=1 Tax=Microbacterium sp. BWT-B31 TaxID=3232072 RepID=UPI0035291C17